MIDSIVTIIKWVAAGLMSIPIGIYLWLVYRHFVMKRKAEQMEYH